MVNSHGSHPKDIIKTKKESVLLVYWEISKERNTRIF